MEIRRGEVHIWAHHINPMRTGGENQFGAEAEVYVQTPSGPKLKFSGPKTIGAEAEAEKRRHNQSHFSKNTHKLYVRILSPKSFPTKFPQG